MELETIKQIIKKQIDIDTSNITMDTTFEDLQIDSLDMAEIVMDIDNNKVNMYFVMVGLINASLMALVYTNDIFTGYVFIEI